MRLRLFRFRSRNPCISRCGSPVRNDCPNTPTLRLTDSVSGSSSHCRSSAFCDAQRFGPAFEQRLDRCSTAASSPPCLRDHVDQAPGERGRRVDIFRRHAPASGRGPSRSAAAAARRGSPRGCRRAPRACRIWRRAPAIRKSQAAATSSPPPRHQPGSRAMTGAGKLRTASQRSRSRVMKASADFWSSCAISLMSAPPIMLFSLWPARITARMSWSPASFSNPSRTPSVTAEQRILSEPALQIVRRTTPRAIAVDAAMGIEHFHLFFSGLGWRFAPLPGHCAGLSRAAGGVLQSGARLR